MKNPFEKSSFGQRIVAGFAERAETVSPKVAQKVKDFYIPKFEDLPEALHQSLDYLEGDLVSAINHREGALANDPEFKDFSVEELAELYKVLFGKEVPDHWIKK